MLLRVCIYSPRVSIICTAQRATRDVMSGRAIDAQRIQGRGAKPYFCANDSRKLSRSVLTHSLTPCHCHIQVVRQGMQHSLQQTAHDCRNTISTPGRSCCCLHYSQRYRSSARRYQERSDPAAQLSSAAASCVRRHACPFAFFFAFSAKRSEIASEIQKASQISELRSAVPVSSL